MFAWVAWAMAEGRNHGKQLGLMPSVIERCLRCAPLRPRGKARRRRRPGTVAVGGAAGRG